MAFGVIGAMNATMKNNRNLLSKREKFKKTIGSYGVMGIEYNFPKATPKLLRDIKKRMIEERQSRQKRIVILWSILMMLCATGFIYLMY